MRVDELERMARDIESGKTPILKPEDTFNFVCDMCGICCTNMDILLNPYDLIRLRRYLKCSTTDLIRRNCVEVFPGGQSRIPLAMFTFRTIGENLHVCPFLAHVADSGKLRKRMAGREEPTLEDLEAAKVPGKMACAVYPVRPGVCRSSPLGRVVSFYQDGEEERAWRDQKVILVSPCPDCRGMKAEASVTVTEWLERNGVLPYWQASRGHQQISAAMVEKGLRLPEKDSKLPAGAKAALTALWHMAAAILYDFDAVSAVASKFPQNRQHEDFREDLALLSTCQEMVRGLTEIATVLCHETDQGQDLSGGGV